MTRTAAREIAIQICYASLLSGTPVNEVTDALFAPEYFSTLSEENEIFRTKPNEKQLSYIRTLTSETASHMDELNAIIEKYSRDWKDLQGRGVYSALRDRRDPLSRRGSGLRDHQRGG